MCLGRLCTQGSWCLAGGGCAQGVVRGSAALRLHPCPGFRRAALAFSLFPTLPLLAPALDFQVHQDLLGPGTPASEGIDTFL